MAWIEERLPSTREYLDLRSAVGWTVPSFVDGRRSLEGSLAGVCACEEGEVVGMGRLVGDGVFYFIIVDLVVHPEFQRQGIGTMVVQRLEEIVSRVGSRRVVNLTASTDIAPFYIKLGYAFTWNVFMERKL